MASSSSPSSGTTTTTSPSATSSSNPNSPCAACKFLRRKCIQGCTFAPYFPPEEPQKFANVHKIFGASNVSKLLNELLPHQREDAVNSLAYEAEARMKDPVYGCVGAISVLQRQVHQLQKELDAANADLMRYACIPTEIPRGISSPTTATAVPMASSRTRTTDLVRLIANGTTNYQPSYFPPPYPAWRNATRDGNGRDMTL